MKDTIRNPAWRLRKYLKVGAVTTVFGVVAGWFGAGFYGALYTGGVTLGLYLLAVPVLEWGERRRDREFRDEHLT